jgi:steroid delta-isomerase-like uncharacterized protein
MSETNKAIAKRWFEEVWNKHRREAIAELLTPDAQIHDGDQVSTGPDGFYPFFDRMSATFSEMHITPHQAIAEGDMVCLRWSCTMRHTGDGLGMPATNKRLEITGISIVRVANGKLIAGWQNWDMLGLLQQINAAPVAATYITAAG